MKKQLQDDKTGTTSLLLPNLSYYALVRVSVGRGTLHLYELVRDAVYGRGIDGRGIDGRGIDGRGNDDRGKDVVPQNTNNVVVIKKLF